MCQRKPSVIVTDGCESMRGAIRAFFPEATHRLCAWHMEKNVTANVKEDGLRELFNRWLYADMEEEVFEEGLEAAIIDYGKLDTFWYNDTYEKRTMWANAYLRDKFCAGFRTTSRCEGINANVKRFLKSRHSILEMVQNLELVVREYRNNELLSQFKSTHGFPVLTTALEPLERHAADVYTREVFFDVCKEIEGISRVIYVSKNRVSTTMVYTIEDYGESGLHIRVLYDRDGKRFDCPCNLWKKKGFSCRHMFFVMKYEHLMEIPESLILNRWRKDAKSVEKYVETSSDGSERTFLLRHGALHSATQWLVYVGAKSHTIFSKAISSQGNLAKTLMDYVMRRVSQKRSTRRRKPR
ncbi:hypothetical protein PIB30_119231 [Stylosanthes scabra]|uniref:Protein FAR1-RELATED SEQUENCE n=1 Tax=Stylosanthes scabra TaxID=79078 RepID=A0ABU6UPL4_9FABA|nr:hypothetical protein [Stylosanthes scabra]